MSATKCVVILISIRTTFGRQILRGVSMYVRPFKPWILHVYPNRSEILGLIKNLNPAGVIAHIGDLQLAEGLMSFQFPVVNVSNAIKDLPVPRVSVDDFAIGQLAATAFIERGFSNFGFCGDLERGAMERYASFMQCLEANGFDHLRYDGPLGDDGLDPDRMQSWQRANPELEQWVLSLPKPIGIFAYQDYLGLTICEICHHLSVAVPEEVALIGVGNDDVLCEMSHPPLASIQTPLQEIGYHAALLLDQLVAGEAPPEKPILLRPHAAVIRQSIDVTAISDSVVGNALHYIRENAGQLIQVNDVVKAVGVSRRSLEYRFARALGRTPLAEIHRARCERAKRLLVETNLPLSRIAEDAGFSSLARMNITFTKLTGMKPADYRQRHRAQWSVGHIPSRIR